jgi:hypothetical protein
VVLGLNGLDLELHAVGAVGGDGADVVVDAWLAQLHGGVAICKLRAEGLCHSALLVIFLGPHFHHVVHFLHVRELCCT